MHKRDFLQGNDRADIWLASVDGSGAPRNLTSGAADGSGYWMPVWSPDGQRLAMLSSKNDNVRLWVWDRSTGRVRKLTERAVNMQGAPPFVWLNDGAIVACLLPEGEQPSSMSVETRAATVAMREWPKTWKGQETTASVLDSGVPADLSRRPQGQIVVIPLDRPARVLATAAVLREPRIAPDGRRLAFLKQVAIVQPDPARLLQHGALNRFASEDRFQIVIEDPSETLAHRARRVSGAPSGVAAILPNTLQWAPDSAGMSFIGAPAGAAADRLRAYRFRADGGDATAVTGDDLDPRATAWSAAGLLVSAEKKGADGKPRADWWLVESTTTSRNLTASMKSAPGELLPEPGARTFVGVADGDVWRVDPAGAVTNLTETFEPKVASIVWPTGAVPRTAGFTHLVLGVQRDVFTDLHRLDLASRTTKAMARPSDFATLAAFRPDTGLAVYTASERTGSFLTVSRDGSQPRAIVETNRFLAEIGEGALRKIDYRGMGGQDLKWVLDDAATPLQQMNAGVRAKAAHLFPAVPAYRYSIKPTRYGEGDKLFHGANPPYGAILTYYLKEKLDSAATMKLEVLDATGAVVREIKRAPRNAGMNRIAWDLSYDPPRPRREVTGPQPADDFFGPPRGPQALPGRYTVRLTTPSERVETAIEVRLDPAIETPVAALREQFDAALRLREMQSVLNDTLRALDVMRTQLDGRKKTLETQGAEQRREQIKQVDREIAQLDSLLGTIARPVGRPFWSEGPRISELLGALQGGIDGTNRAPTRHQVQLLGELRVEYEAALRAISAFLARSTRVAM